MFGPFQRLRGALAGPLTLPTFLRPLLLIPYVLQVVWRYFEDILERSRASGRLFGPLEQAVAGIIVIGLAWQGGFFDGTTSPAIAAAPAPYIPPHIDRVPAVYRSRKVSYESSHIRHTSHTSHSSHTRYIPPAPYRPRSGSIEELVAYVKSMMEGITLPHVLLVLLVVNVVLMMLPDDKKKQLQERCRTMVFGSMAESAPNASATGSSSDPPTRAAPEAGSRTDTSSRSTGAEPADGSEVSAKRSKEETPDERLKREAKENAAAAMADTKAAETPEERAKRKAAEKAMMEQKAKSATDGIPTRKADETPEERAKRKEAEKAVLLKRAEAASDGKVPAKRPDETPEERAKRKPAEAAASSAAKDQVKSTETPEERAKRKAKEKAASEDAQAQGETPEERSRRREKEKAASAAAAGLVTADKTDQADGGTGGELKPAETTEERAKRKAAQAQAAGSSSRLVSGTSRSAETPEERAKRKAAEPAKLKATKSSLSDRQASIETPEERLKRKAAEAEKTRGIEAAEPAPVAGTARDETTKQTLAPKVAEVAAKDPATRAPPVAANAIPPAPASAPPDSTARAEMERRKAELRAQRMAAYQLTAADPPATGGSTTPASVAPLPAPAAAPVTNPVAPVSASVAIADPSPSPASEPPNSAPIVPSDSLMESETKALRSVLKKPKKGHRQLRNIHHNQFLTMRAHKAALVPFPHGLHPPPHSPPHTLWWRNIPKDAEHLMAHPAVPKEPEGLKPGEEGADEKAKAAAKEKEEEKAKKADEKGEKDKSAKDEGKAKDAEKDQDKAKVSSTSSSSRTPEEEKARALAKARAAKEAEAAKAGGSSGRSKEAEPEKARSSSSSSRSATKPSEPSAAPAPADPQPLTARERQLEKAQLVTQVMLCTLVFFLHEQLALCLMGFFAYQHFSERRIRAAQVAAAQAATAAAAATKQAQAATKPTASSRSSRTAPAAGESGATSRSIEDPDKARSRAGSSETAMATREGTTTGPSAGAKTPPSKPVAHEGDPVDTDGPRSQLRPLMLSSDPDVQTSREIRRQEKRIQDLKAEPATARSNPVVTVASSAEASDRAVRLDEETEAQIKAKLEKVSPEKRDRYEKMMRAQALAEQQKLGDTDPPSDIGKTEDVIVADIKVPAEDTSRNSKEKESPASPARTPVEPRSTSVTDANDELEKRIQRKLKDIPPDKRAKYEKIYRDKYAAERELKPTTSPIVSKDTSATLKATTEQPLKASPDETTGSAEDELEIEVQRQLQKVPEEKRAKYAMIIRDKLLSKKGLKEPPGRVMPAPAVADDDEDQAKVHDEPPRQPESIEEAVQRKLTDIPPEQRQEHEKMLWEKALAERSMANRSRSAVQHSPSSTATKPLSDVPHATNTEQDVEKPTQRQIRDVPPDKRDKKETILRQEAPEAREAALVDVASRDIDTVKIAGEGTGSAARPPTEGIPIRATSPNRERADPEVEEEVHRQLLKVPVEKREKYEKIFWAKALEKRAAKQREARSTPVAPAGRPATVESDPDIAISQTHRPAEEMERYILKKLETVPVEKRDKYAKVYRERFMAEQAAKDASAESGKTTASTAPLASPAPDSGSANTTADAAQKATSQERDEEVERYVQKKLEKVPVEKRDKYAKLYREQFLAERAARDESTDQSVAAADTNTPDAPAPASAAVTSPAEPSQEALAGERDEELERYVLKKLEKVPVEKREKYEKIYRQKAMAERQRKTGESTGKADDDTPDPESIALSVTPAPAPDAPDKQPVQSDPSAGIAASDPEIESYVQRKLKEVPVEKRNKYAKIYRERALAERAAKGAAPKGKEGKKAPDERITPTDEGKQQAAEIASGAKTDDAPATSDQEIKSDTGTLGTPRLLDPADDIEQQVRERLSKIPAEKQAKYEPVIRQKLLAKQQPPDSTVSADHASPEGTAKSVSGAGQRSDTPKAEQALHRDDSKHTDSHHRQPMPVAGPASPATTTSSGDGDEVEAYVRRKLAKIPIEKRARYEKVYRDRALAGRARQPEVSGHIDEQPNPSAAPETSETPDPLSAPAGGPTNASTAVRPDDGALEVSLPPSESSTRSTTPTDEPDDATRRKVMSYREEISPKTRAAESPIRSATRRRSEKAGTAEAGIDSRFEAEIQAKLAMVPAEKRERYERRIREKTRLGVSIAHSPSASPVTSDPASSGKVPLTPLSVTPVNKRVSTESVRRHMTGKVLGPAKSPVSATTHEPRTITLEERQDLERRKAERRAEHMAAAAAAAVKSPSTPREREVQARPSAKSTSTRTDQKSGQAASRRPHATPLQPASTPSLTSAFQATPRADASLLKGPAVPDSATLPQTDSIQPSFRPKTRKPSANAILDVQRVREALRRISESDNENFAPYRVRRSSSVGEQGFISFGLPPRSTTPEGEPKSAPLERQLHGSGIERLERVEQAAPGQGEGAVRMKVAAHRVKEETNLDAAWSSPVDKGKGKMTAEMLDQYEKEKRRASRQNTAKRIETSTEAISEKPREPRYTAEQLAQMPTKKREKYERYLAAKAKEREARRSGTEHAQASSSPSSRSTDRSSKEDRSGRSSRDRVARIRVEDLTPEQVERMQRARELRKREAARVAKKAGGQGSSGLSVEEKAELSGT